MKIMMVWGFRLIQPNGKEGEITMQVILKSDYHEQYESHIEGVKFEITDEGIYIQVGDYEARVDKEKLIKVLSILK
jgi:hypothetical protein